MRRGGLCGTASGCVAPHANGRSARDIRLRHRIRKTRRIDFLRQAPRRLSRPAQLTSRPRRKARNGRVAEHALPAPSVDDTKALGDALAELKAQGAIDAATRDATARRPQADRSGTLAAIARVLSNGRATSHEPAKVTPTCRDETRLATSRYLVKPIGNGARTERCHRTKKKPDEAGESAQNTNQAQDREVRSRPSETATRKRSSETGRD